MPPHAPRSAEQLREVALVFLKLGCIAFGGPAAHIALMREEVVRRRQWMDEQRLLDLLGATNLIPGPNSTELAIHIGFVRAGWRGLIVAGVLFIAPAMLIVLGIAWAYVRFGTLPQATALLYGIKPVILAVVVQALWSLAATAVKGPLTSVVGVLSLGLYAYGVNEITILIGSGVLMLLVRGARWWRADHIGAAWLLPTLAWPTTDVVQANSPIDLGRLFLIFLKIGSVLYGSGYVLLAFLRSDVVLQTGWISDQQLLDAVAIGQFTPGPVFTTATFIGYLVAGFPGAVLATIGIFLPSFVFVALSHPLVPRMRRSPLTAPVLDGVNVASLALMLVVTLQLGRSAIVDPRTIVLALVALVLLIRFKVNSAWLVLGGGLVGLLASSTV